MEPTDLAELEARCWRSAGGRMSDELARALFPNAPSGAPAVLHRVVPDLGAPIARLFGDARFEAAVAQLDYEQWCLLAGAFLSWAGEGQAALYRAVDGLGESPPAEPAALHEWAERHDVLDHLSHPVRWAAPLAGTVSGRYQLLSCTTAVTVSEILTGRFAVLGADARNTLTSYLAWAAGRRAAEVRRLEVWRRAPASPQVATAVARIAALLEELAQIDLTPLPAELVTSGPTEQGSEWAIVVKPITAIAGRRVGWVSFFERRGEVARSGIDDRRSDRAIVRLACEHALDALLDEAHPEHAGLRASLERPRWNFLLEDLLRQVNEPEPPRAFAEEERLIWRFDVDPPRVEAAIQKKTKRGSWSKGRVADSRALVGREGLDPRDVAALRAAVTDPYANVFGNPGEVLEALIGHPRVVWGAQRNTPLRVGRGAIEVRLTEQRGLTWIRFAVDDVRLEPHELLGRSVHPRHVVLLDEARCAVTVVPLPESVLQMAFTCARWEAGLPPQADEALLTLLARLPASVGVELPPRLRGERVDASARPALRLEPLPGGTLRVEMFVRPLEGGALHRSGEGPRHIVGAREGRRVHVVRDPEAEREAAERAEAVLGLDTGSADGPRAWRLDDPERALDVIAALREHPEVASAEWPSDAWQVVGTASWSNTKVKATRLTEWFALRGEAKIDEEKVGLAQIVAALREGRRYVALGKGRFVRIEEELRRNLSEAADVVFEEGKELAVAGDAIGRLEALVPTDAFTGDAAWKRMRKRLAAAPRAKVAPPKELKAELRGYQRAGVEWLLRTSSWASGACLADDMGLGKTIQALALLLARRGEGPALVVCPTSLSDNWRREMKRFAPALRPVLYRGAERAPLLEGLAPGDVLIASYDVVLRDVDALEALELGTLVLDEAHAVKNAEALRTKAARRLRAGFRLGLTGTPIENHLGELWSLFSVLVPGLLGPWRHFRGRFATAIERDSDLVRREALRDLLRPFLLRRQKAEVAPELPPRIDVVHTVELTDEERALYEAERRRAVEALEAEDGDNTQRFRALAALTRLRRLACHPTLVDPQSMVASSKLAATLSLAEDLAREGHRALIFSQFTSHLALVRRALGERGFETLYLDGATPAPKRGELVHAFQTGDAPFFLISLKAGGTGLNLTAADTVLHLDPWWNPAAEDQASDRTHRIGQDSPVTVIRLVAQGTIEETVVELHEHKRELARGVLEGAETNAKLSTKDLLALMGDAP